MYALTEIKGVGRRYSNIVCKKADVDLNKRYVLRSLSNKSLLAHEASLSQRWRA